MSSALKALKTQVEAGLTQKSDASMKNPVQLGDLIKQAEVARNELPSTGFRR